MHLTVCEAIIFQAVPVTNRGRIEYVSELALVIMGAEVKQFCWDC